MAKGYAETSLTDLAVAAGMTVSHLLYYYGGKEAVLAELCDQVFDRIVDDVYAYKSDPTEERIHGLVSNLFIRGAVVRSELPLVRELGALAIHRPEIRRRTEAYGQKMRDYLEDLFAGAPRQPGLSPVDAAKIASALWSGFVNNIEFDEALSDSKARELFRRTLFFLAGLPTTPPPRSPTRRTGQPNPV